MTVSSTDGIQTRYLFEVHIYMLPVVK